MNGRSKWVMAALLWGAAVQVQAAVFCVSTETQLRAALATIGSSFDSSVNEVRLTQGVFFTGTQVFEVQVSGPTGDTIVSGGWTSADATPCDVQSIDARLTVLDAQSTSQVLSIRRNSVSNNATPLIRVSNLTIRNGSSTTGSAGLTIRNSFGDIEVDNVVLHGHRMVDAQFVNGVAVTLDASRRDIRLRNSLLYDNLGNCVCLFPLPSALFTSLDLNSNRNWYATNNTIVAGPDESASALRMQSDGNFWVINNVLRGGVAYTSSITGAGSALDPLVRQLFNNFASTPTTDRATLLSSQSNTMVAPELDPLSRGLLPSSPLVNAGLGAPPGGLPGLDVLGQPRVFGTFVDVGAIELQQAPVLPVRIFGNGFE